MFQVDASVTAAVSGVTIADGSVSGIAEGGGVWNLGSMTLSNCTISGNHAGNQFGYYYERGEGGGIANDGSMTVTGSTIKANDSSRRRIARGPHLYLRRRHFQRRYDEAG